MATKIRATIARSCATPARESSCSRPCSGGSGLPQGGAPGGARRGPAAAAPVAPAKPAAYAPRVEMIVNEEGFVPSRVKARAGQPLTLAITRKTDKTCATEIVFKGQEGKTELPLDKTVEVVFTPKASGEVAFGCGMGMMIGGVLDVAD